MLPLEDILRNRFESVGILEGRTYHGKDDGESAIIFLRIQHNNNFNLRCYDVYIIVHPDSFLFEPEMEYFDGEKLRIIRYIEWATIQSILFHIEDSYGKPVPDIFHKAVELYKKESTSNIKTKVTL